jgi:ketosteroid isomerase-like protein
MTNEEFVREAYAIAEVKDIDSWVACFNPDAVIVELALQGTHDGPLWLPQGSTRIIGIR